MFSCPSAGWCRIEIAGWSSPGSYLEDYPLTIPRALLAAWRDLKRNECSSDIVEFLGDDAHPSFLVDAESDGEFLVSLVGGQISVYDGTEFYDPIVGSQLYTKEVLRNLAFIAMTDLLEGWDAWVYEWSYLEEGEDGELTKEGTEAALDRQREMARALACLSSICR